VFAIMNERGAMVGKDLHIGMFVCVCVCVCVYVCVGGWVGVCVVKAPNSE